MPRFTYKDWVGRNAVCLRDMRNGVNTVRFKKGEIVKVQNYDRWSLFGIKKGKRFLLKIRPEDIRLVENPRETLKERVLTYLRRATMGKETYWPTATVVAKGLDEKLSVVSSMLSSLANDGDIRREEKQGPRGGYGYRLYETDAVAKTSRYDWIMRDEDVI